MKITRILFSTAIELFDGARLKESEKAQIIINLGSVYEGLGRSDEAALLFDRAIAIDRDYSRGFTQAAAFFARRGQFDKADTLFFRGKETGPLSAGDYFNWGLAYIEWGKPEEGVRFMNSALREDSKLYQAHYCIAVAYFEANMPLDSVNYHLDRCLIDGPAFDPAIRLKQIVIDKGRP